MTVLVTGATGHLGNVLVRELIARGEKVKVLVPPSDDITSIEGLDVERIQGDVLDLGSLRRGLEGVQTVYHLAGILFTSPRRSHLLYRVNLDGTRNVAAACMECGVGRMVYTSSIQALVQPPKGKMVDELGGFDPAKVTGHYAKSKAMASLEVLSAAAKGLDALIVCPTGAIGPYDFRPSKMGNWFLQVATNKLDGRIYTVGGTYDFVDVRDLAAAQIEAAQKGRSGEVYILSGEALDQKEQVRLLQQASGVNGRCYGMMPWQLWMVAYIAHLYNWIRNTTPGVTLDEARIVTSNCLISHEKATRELAYNPRPMKETILDTINWYRDTGRLPLRITSFAGNGQV